MLCALLAACLQLPVPRAPQATDVRGSALQTRIQGRVRDLRGSAVNLAKVYLIQGFSVPEGAPTSESLGGFVDAADPSGLDGALQSTPMDGSLQSTPLDGVLQTSPLALRYPVGPLVPVRILSATRSDAQGHFVLDAPRTGHFTLKVVGSEDGQVASRQIVLQGATATLDLGPVVLARTWTIRGQVAVPPGRRPEEVVVFLPGGDRWVRPGSDGFFTLAGVPPGTSAVAYIADGLPAQVRSLEAFEGPEVSLGEVILAEPPPRIRRVLPDVVAPGTEVTVEGDNFGSWSRRPWGLYVGDVQLSQARRLDDRHIRLVWPNLLATGPITVAVDGSRSEIATISVAASWSVDVPTASIALGEVWNPGLRVLDVGGRPLPDAGAWSWNGPADWAVLEDGGWRATVRGRHLGTWRLGSLMATADVRVSSHLAGILLEAPGAGTGQTEGRTGVRLFHPAWLLAGPDGGWWFCDRRSVSSVRLPELPEIRRLAPDGEVRVVRSAPDGAGVRWSHAARLGPGVVLVSESDRALEVWQPEATRVCGVDVQPASWTRLPAVPGLASHDGVPGPVAWHRDWGLAVAIQSVGRFELMRLSPEGQWSTLLLARGQTFPEPDLPVVAPEEALVRASALAWTEDGSLLVGSTARVWAWPRQDVRLWGRMCPAGRFTALVGHGGLDGGPVGVDPMAVSLRVVSGLALVGGDLWIADGNHGRLIVLESSGRTVLAGGEGERKPEGTYLPLLDQKWLRPGPLAVGPDGELAMLDRISGTLLRLVPSGARR